MLRHMPAAHVLIFVLLLVCFDLLVGGTAAAQPPPEGDPWQILHRLEGRWAGTSEGFGVVSDLTHEWAWVIDDTYLRLRTRSVPRDSAHAQDVHVDVGYMSWDTEHSAFVFRQFLNEGYVNTYDIVVKEEKGPTIVFEYREVESGKGLRARMELVFRSEDQYEMALELAFPGKDFVGCQTMRVRRE
jgi:hypothetical protein